MYFDHEAYEKLDLDLIMDKVQVSSLYGRDRKKGLRPYFSKSELTAELAMLETVVAVLGKRRPWVTRLRHALAGLKEIRGTLRRLEDGESLSEIELFELKKFVFSVRQVARLQEEEETLPRSLRVERMMEVEGWLDPLGDGVPTFHVYDVYSKELADLRRDIGAIEAALDEERRRLAGELAARYGVKIRTNGSLRISKNAPIISAVRVDGHLAYVSEEFGLLEYRVVLGDRHEGMMETLSELLTREQQEEERIKVELSTRLTGQVQRFRENLETLAHLDLMVGKAAFALGYGLSRPEIIEDQRIEIHQGINLPVLDRLRREGMDYTPVDIVVKQGATVITGSNMGGKTVTLKLIGQIVAMAQLGLFVPAGFAAVTLRDFIYISVGDRQDIDLGLSSFAGEMVALTQVIDRSDLKGLILIDELSKGTNPQEGYAISRSIADALDDSGSICVLTSHFDGIASGKVHYQVRGLRDLDLSELASIATLHRQMDFTLEKVHDAKQVPKEAIPIAQMLGLREDIIEKARRYLDPDKGGKDHEQ